MPVVKPLIFHFYQVIKGKPGTTVLAIYFRHIVLGVA